MKRLLPLLVLLPLVCFGQQSTVGRRAYAISNSIPLGWPQQGTNFFASMSLSNSTIYGNNASIYTTNLGGIGLNGNDQLFDLTISGTGNATNDYQTILAPADRGIPQNMRFKDLTVNANSDGIVGTLSSNSLMTVQNCIFNSHFDGFNMSIGTNSAGYMFNSLFSGVYTTNVLPADGIFGSIVRGAVLAGGTWYVNGCTFEARGATNGGYCAALEVTQDPNGQPTVVYLAGCAFISASTNAGSTAYLLNIQNPNCLVYSDVLIPRSRIGGNPLNFFYNGDGIAMTNTGHAIITGGNAALALTATTTTLYEPLGAWGFAGNAASTVHHWRMPYACTLTNLFVQCDTGIGPSTNFSVYLFTNGTAVLGAGGALGAVIGPYVGTGTGTPFAISNKTFSVNVPQNTYCHIAFSNNAASAPAAQIMTWSVEARQ